MPAVAGPWARMIDVGAKLVVEPDLHGFAETADHDADADHHGDGGGERGDDDRGARERRDETASGDEACGARDAFQCAAQESDHAGDECGRDHGGGGDREQRGGIAEDGPSVDRSELAEDRGDDGGAVRR